MTRTAIQIPVTASKASFRTNPLVLLRAAISDRWLPRYRLAVSRLLIEQGSEVSEDLAEGNNNGPTESQVNRWAREMAELKRKWGLNMIKAGYDLAAEEFGEEKIADVEIPTDPDEFLLRHATQGVEEYINETSAIESRTSAARIRRILTAADTFVDPETGRGRTPREIAKLFSLNWKRMTPARAEMMARTLTIWSYNEGAKQRYQDVGVSTVEWLATEDDLLCEFCEAMDGRRASITVPFLGDGDTLDGTEGGALDVPFDIEHPPVHPNCVVPGTEILASDIAAGFVAPYCGPIIEATLSDGRRFTVSPNHMLLTPFGFVSAARLRKGDDVLDCGTGKRVISRHPNNDRDPSIIDEAIEALSKSRGMSSRRVPMSPEYLHGDGTFLNGDIDIIAPDSFLRGGIDSVPLECFHKIPFGWPDTDPPALVRFGNLPSMFFRLALAADSIMGGRREGSAFLDREPLHSDFVGLGRCAPGYPFSFKPALDCSTGDAEPVGNRKLRLPRGVTLAQVRDLRVRYFSGHLYDLQTFSSLYTVNGVVSSNCRCALIPVTE